MKLKQLENKLDDLSIQDLEEIMFSLGDYEEMPVDIETFVTDEYYLGGFFNGKFRPYWLEVLKRIFPSPACKDEYNIVVLKGSIGRGKTWAGCVGILYDIHKLLCLKSPQEHIGAMWKDRLFNVFFDVTEKGAEESGWGSVTSMMNSSPYFREQLAKAPKIKTGSLLPKNIDLKIASRLHQTLGKGVLNVLLDEANFGIIKNQVPDVFNSLLRRRQSRFLPGKIWITTSEKSSSSAVNNILKGYEGKEGVYIDGGSIENSALWHVVPERYSKERFKIFVGNETIQPEIIENDESNLLKEFPELIIDVPEELRSEFERDIHSTLRDLAGIGTELTYRLFKDKVRLNKAIKTAAIFPDVIQLDFDDDNDQIYSRLLFKEYFNNTPYGNNPRTIHIDIGLTNDSLGIAACVLTGFEKKRILDPVTLEYVDVTVPMTATEWSFGIKNKPGQEVPLDKVKTFLFWLAKKKYPINCISFDSYQSRHFKQLMEKEGFTVDIVSVDKETYPYFNLRDCMYKGYHTVPHSANTDKKQNLKKELQELEVIDSGRRVDHPIEGSKDIADGVAGSHYVMTRDAYKYRWSFAKPIEKSRSEKFIEDVWGEML
jgi:hypothetical protein